MKTGNCIRYTGKAVFQTDENYAKAALDAMPDFKNIYNETTGHKMMMTRRKDATAVIIPLMGEGGKINCYKFKVCGEMNNQRPFIFFLALCERSGII